MEPRVPDSPRWFVSLVTLCEETASSCAHAAHLQLGPKTFGPAVHVLGPLHISSSPFTPKTWLPCPPTISTADKRLCHPSVLLKKGRWLPCSSGQEMKREKHLYTQHVMDLVFPSPYGLPPDSMGHLAQPCKPSWWHCCMGSTLKPHGSVLHDRLLGITSIRASQRQALCSFHFSGCLFLFLDRGPVSHLTWKRHVMGHSLFPFPPLYISVKALWSSAFLGARLQKGAPCAMSYLTHPLPGPRPCEAQQHCPVYPSSDSNTVKPPTKNLPLILPCGHTWSLSLLHTWGSRWVYTCLHLVCNPVTWAWLLLFSESCSVTTGQLWTLWFWLNTENQDVSLCCQLGWLHYC